MPVRRLLPALLFFLLPAAAQAVPPAAVAGLAWRSIGPATTGGRIADFAVAEVPGEPEVMYVGTASGGVFKSANAGVSWKPIFDHAGGMMSIGAVAVAPSNPSIVWVGTGEVDNRQSSSWGDGIYKSLDGGTTWKKMGLADSRHIAKIIVDPHDASTVYVAALGHLWGPNSERGVYKTTDGGSTWSRVLAVDDNTGATDLAMSPADPNVLFAAMYQRQRKGWGFNGGGPGSGLYRSDDAGRTWTKLAGGLPTGTLGRIGIAIYPRDPRIVFAIVEADPQHRGVYRSEDQGQTWERMSAIDPRPSYYSRIYVDPRDPNRVYIMGSERGFYISDDAGRNFRDVFSQVHGEDHALWIDPRDPNHLLVGGDGGVSISFDRGLTWLFRDNLPIGQFYEISVSNEGEPTNGRPGAEPPPKGGASRFMVCGGLQDNGNWCTPSATSLSYGLSNRDAFNVGGGDGMYARFDGDDHTLLVSLQNGNTSRVDLANWARQAIAPVQPETEPAPPARGTAPAGAYRWYWTSPLVVSHFSPRVLYTGANVLFRSDDQGASWKAISPDLTAHIDRTKLEMMGAPIPADAPSKNDGQDNFSALTVIAESPLDAQVLYTGADDGTLQVTRDGGAHWSNLTAHLPGLPSMTNVSGIVASRYAPGRVYATFDGHFNDDYRAHVYASDDYGQTWKSIAGDLPDVSIHRLRENPTNPDFLVIGTEQGVYATWDRGAHWTSLDTNLPPVPVYDLRYAENGHALVLGTHGRGIWVLDDADPLVGLGAAVAAGGDHVFPVAPAHRTNLYSPQAWFGAGEFFAPNPPQGAVIPFYLAKASAKEATLTVTGPDHKEIRHLTVPIHAGLNQAVWDLHWEGVSTGGGRGGFNRGPAVGPWVAPGAYSVSIAAAGDAPISAPVTVTAESAVALTPAQRQQREAAIMSAYQLTQKLAAVKSRTPAQNRALALAERVERAMDGYEGLPTADQLRQLAWAQRDAGSAQKR